MLSIQKSDWLTISLSFPRAQYALISQHGLTQFVSVLCMVDLHGGGTHNIQTPFILLIKFASGYYQTFPIHSFLYAAKYSETKLN